MTKPNDRASGNDNLLAMRAAHRRGDARRVRDLKSRMRITDAADPRFAAEHLGSRLQELDALEERGQVSHEYAARERVAAAIEYRDAVGIPDDPERLLTDSELAEVRKRYGV